MFLLLASLAHAADLDVGLGFRSSQNPYYAAHYGLHPFGRVLFSQHLGIEAGAYVRFPGDRLSSLTQTLVFMGSNSESGSTFQVPIDREAAAVEVLAVVSPWKRPHEDKLTAWIAGTVGVSGMLMTHGVAAIHPDGDGAVETRAGSATLAFGPVLGLTLEGVVADRFGLRLTGLQRYYLAKEPDYGNVGATLKAQVYAPAVLTLDLMVHL